jgi:uncharacterized membrane protein YdjX (TVP38/TMEM64 family)
MWKKDALRILIVVSIFVTALFVLHLEPVRENLLDITKLRDSLHPDDRPVTQLCSSLLFILFGSLLIGIGMPRLLVSAAGGGVFGALLGTILALVASVLGSLITYVAGRSLLGSVVRRRLGKYSRFTRLQAHLAENAFLYTLSLRLFPFSNTTVASLACGSCKVPIGPYILASLLGFLPLTIVFAVFGSGAAKADEVQIGLGIIFLLLVIIIQRRLAPFFHRDDEPDEDGKA